MASGTTPLLNNENMKRGDSYPLLQDNDMRLLAWNRDQLGKALRNKKLPFFVRPCLYSTLFYENTWRVAKIWGIPMFLAGFGFCLQNFQLHIALYYYVHKMVQYDLQRDFTNSAGSNVQNYTEIPLSFGFTPYKPDISFGSLEDPIAGQLPTMEKPISELDLIAGLFPFFYVILAVFTDNAYSWTKVMVAFFFLAFFKGMFGWITVEPDSSGWQNCKDRRLGPDKLQWYAESRTLFELLNMYFKNPGGRFCGDMMYSGHTYFVTLFALGLFELVRLVSFRLDRWKRMSLEIIVASAAIFQQVFEIVVVLRTRFHYTADVVMALLITYLMFTNSAIAALASWWTKPISEIHHPLGDLDKLITGPETQPTPWSQNKWLRAFKPSGMISLGCCCCSWSQQWLYDRGDLKELMKVAEESRNSPRKDSMEFDMSENIQEWEMSLLLKLMPDDSLAPCPSCFQKKPEPAQMA